MPSYRDVMKVLLNNSGALMREDYFGQIGPVALDIPLTVVRNITNSEILLDSSEVAIWNYQNDNAKNIITSIELNYKPEILGEEVYLKKKTCNYLDSGDATNFILDEDGKNPDFYVSLLQDSFDTIDEERRLTINIQGIRDDDTAERLARLIIEYRAKIKKRLLLTCSYSVLDIEMWDKIGVTASIIPSFLQGIFWLVIRQSIFPCIGKQQPKVILELLEIGGDGFLCEVIQDVFSDTNQIQDVFSDTNNIQDTFNC